MNMYLTRFLVHVERIQNGVARCVRGDGKRILVPVGLLALTPYTPLLRD
jgi:hypothetical protein